MYEWQNWNLSSEPVSLLIVDVCFVYIFPDPNCINSTNKDSTVMKEKPGGEDKYLTDIKVSKVDGNKINE